MRTITGKELAEYCKKSDCDNCENKQCCENFSEYISDYSPYILLEYDRIGEIIKHLLECEF